MRITYWNSSCFTYGLILAKCRTPKEITQKEKTKLTSYSMEETSAGAEQTDSGEMYFMPNTVYRLQL